MINQIKKIYSVVTKTLIDPFVNSGISALLLVFVLNNHKEHPIISSIMGFFCIWEVLLYIFYGRVNTTKQTYKHYHNPVIKQALFTQQKAVDDALTNHLNNASKITLLFEMLSDNKISIEAFDYTDQNLYELLTKWQKAGEECWEEKRRNGETWHKTEEEYKQAVDKYKECKEQIVEYLINEYKWS